MSANNDKRRNGARNEQRRRGGKWGHRAQRLSGKAKRELARIADEQAIAQLAQAMADRQRGRDDDER